MSENQFHYGTGFTSVRTHAPPGGSSNFSLGWDEPSAAPAKPVQQAHNPIAPAEPENKPPTEEEEEQEAPVIVKRPPGGFSTISFG